MCCLRFAFLSYDRPVIASPCSFCLFSFCLSLYLPTHSLCFVFVCDDDDDPVQARHEHQQQSKHARNAAELHHKQLKHQQLQAMRQQTQQQQLQPQPPPPDHYSYGRGRGYVVPTRMVGMDPRQPQQQQQHSRGGYEAYPSASFGLTNNRDGVGMAMTAASAYQQPPPPSVQQYLQPRTSFFAATAGNRRLDIIPLRSPPLRFSLCFLVHFSLRLFVFVGFSSSHV